MNIEKEMNRWLKEHFPEVIEKWEKHKKDFLKSYYQDKFDAIREWFDSGNNIPEEIETSVKMILEMQEKNPEHGYQHRRLILQLCRNLEGWPYTR
jgi:alpha-mannosidase